MNNRQKPVKTQNAVLPQLLSVLTLSQQQTLARDWSSISLIFHSLSIKRPELIMLCLTFKGNQAPQQTIWFLPNFIEMMPAVIC